MRACNVQNGNGSVIDDYNSNGDGPRPPYFKAPDQGTVDAEQRAVAQRETHVHPVDDRWFGFRYRSRSEDRRLRMDPDRWHTT